MTHYTAGDLAMAERHIAEGEACIVRQEAVLTSLYLHGLPTGEAETLLRLFNQSHAANLLHRDAIEEALENG